MWMWCGLTAASCRSRRSLRGAARLSNARPQLALRPGPPVRGANRLGLQRVVILPLGALSSDPGGERLENLRWSEGLIEQSSKRFGLLACLRPERSNQIAAQSVVVGVGSR